MQVEIDTSKEYKIDWGATGAKEVVQNVIILINTMKYEVAYDRTLGIDGDYQDKPLQEAITLATAQIYDVIEQREPRAIVKDVIYTSVDKEGNTTFKVVIEI